MTPPDAKGTARAERLRAFCERADGLPFTWGKDDCTLWTAQWFEQESGIILNLPAYNNEEQARKMIEDAGGLHFLWSHLLSENGVHEAYPPELGDVGIIQFGDKQMGCIFAAGNIAIVRAEKRIAYVRGSSSIQSWKVPGRHA